jgi:type III secretion protein F
MTIAAPLTFDFINSTVLAALTAKEATLKTSIQTVGTDASPVQLLDLQQQVQAWTIMAQIQGTIVKEVSDAMKSAIQKAG